MKAAIHSECGQIAFYLHDDVTIRDPMDSRKVYDLEGNHPALGSRVQCYSCGASVENFHVTIDWEDNSYAIQQRRVEEEKPDQTGLDGLSLAETQEEGIGK